MPRSWTQDHLRRGRACEGEQRQIVVKPDSIVTPCASAHRACPNGSLSGSRFVISHDLRVGDQVLVLTAPHRLAVVRQFVLYVVHEIIEAVRFERQDTRGSGSQDRRSSCLDLLLLGAFTQLTEAAGSREAPWLRSGPRSRSPR
jgi:hypothetical protein